MQQKILELTKELVRIPSISSDIDQLHTVIDRIAQEFEWYENVYIEKIIHNQKPSLVIKNFDGLRWDVCLNGHVDVVPAAESQFEPVQRDGKLYGRWTIDMKAAVSVMIFVMKNLLDQQTDKKVLCVFTSDEEIWGADGAGHVAALWYGADVLLTPDVTWLWHVTIAQKGTYTMELAIQGTSGHSAYPRKSENAIEKTMRMYQEMKDGIEESIELTQDTHRWTSVQMTTIQAGKALNAIPGQAYCTINIRHTESYTQVLLQNMCKHIVQKYDAKIVSEKYGSLSFVSEDHPVLQLYKKVSEQVLWSDIWFARAHGSTDSRYFADQWAIAILHGLDGADLHGDDEHVVIASMQVLYDIMSVFIDSLDDSFLDTA